MDSRPLPSSQDSPSLGSDAPGDDRSPAVSCSPICPYCSGPVIEIRAKRLCQRCHQILETCCEGGRQ